MISKSPTMAQDDVDGNAIVSSEGLRPLMQFEQASLQIFDVQTETNLTQPRCYLQRNGGKILPEFVAPKWFVASASAQMWTAGMASSQR